MPVVGATVRNFFGAGTTVGELQSVWCGDGRLIFSRMKKDTPNTVEYF